MASPYYPTYQPNIQGQPGIGYGGASMHGAGPQYTPPSGAPGIGGAPGPYQPNLAYGAGYRPQYGPTSGQPNLYSSQPMGVPNRMGQPNQHPQGMYNPQVIPKAGLPLPNQSATLTSDLIEKMDDPINPYDNNEEREMNDTMSDLFAALKTLEYLEKSYSTSRILYYDYNKQCISLVQQVNHMVAIIHTTVPQIITLFANMGVKFDRAAVRLREGKPAELPSSAGSFTKMASNITGMVLTLLDYMELNYKSVNELGIKVKELEGALVSATQYLPKNFSFTAAMNKWAKRFQEWGPTYVLPDETLKELKYDLESGMADFEKAL